MADTTDIEWADSTFNPWIGCTKISLGCDGCYAERDFAQRKGRVIWGSGQERSLTKTWGNPPRWNKQHAEFLAQQGRRRRVFCASLADVFDNEVPVDWRVDLFKLIAATPHLDWLLLTKRIGNAHSMMREVAARVGGGEQPLDNVWLGATVVNQVEADRDIPKLLATPARVRFLSIEPMLGPIDLTSIRVPLRGDSYTEGNVLVRKDALNLGAPRASLDWVIAGGESGPRARPSHPDWFRSLRDQCAEAGVPFLFKQWGEWVPADDDIADGIVPVSDICGDIPFTEGKRVRTQWLSPNGGIVGHSFAMVGKKAAGRRLDGAEHLAWPASHNL